MRGPITRCTVALVLLAVYYGTLLGTSAPAPAALGEAATLRDIEASRVAFTAGRYADALEPTERLTMQFPTQAVYFDRLARIQQRLGRPQREARAWESVFRTSPTPEDACPMLAAAYERIPDPVRALEAYERCVQVSPSDPDMLLFLGRAYNAAGRAEPAREALEKALAIDAEYPDVHLVLGIRDFEDGRLGAARSRFERFAALAPTRLEEVAVWIERTRTGSE
jgi:tetratricopeptide (TPR) repeat protein